MKSNYFAQVSFYSKAVKDTCVTVRISFKLAQNKVRSTMDRRHHGWRETRSSPVP